MAQQGLTSFLIKDFKGMRNWEPAQRIPPNYLYYAQNSKVTGGRWKSKQGVSAYGDALVGGTRFRGLFYYPRRVSGVTTPYIFAYYNSQWEAYDTGNDTHAPIPGTTWTADEDCDGVVYNNQLYVVSPTNGMAWFDGVTWSTTFTGTPPAGSIIETNSGKIWVTGVPAFPNLVYYSRTALASAPENARDWVTGSGSYLLGDGGYNTAMINLKNVLYVFKNDTIFYLTGFTADDIPLPKFEVFSVTAGCINKDCAVLAENDVWFLTANLEIRTLGNVENFLGDPRTRDISLAIKRSLEELDSDQSNATMSYFEKTMKISLRTAGSPINNWTLEYDFNDNSFEITRIASQKYFVNNTKQLFYSEDGESGQLYKDDSGYSANGQSYEWRGKTVMWDMGRLDIPKRQRYLHIYLGRSANQVVYVDLFQNIYSSTPTTYTLEAPTVAETGAVVAEGDGVFGGAAFGGSVFGGSGLNINPGNEPTLYYRDFKIDINQTAKMFGVQLRSTINGGLISVEQITFEGIILPQKNKYVDI